MLKVLEMLREEFRTAMILAGVYRMYLCSLGVMVSISDLRAF